MRFINPVTNITALPDNGSTAISQGLYGESVKILEKLANHALVRNERDGYEGYIPLRSIRETDATPTHYVVTRASLVFAEPSIKTPIIHRLVFGSELSLVDDVDDVFALTSEGHFALKSHYLIMPTPLATDLATVAENLFLGAPYIWGGRSPDGFDCSGLTQMAAFACGHRIRRDSDQQLESIANEVTFAQRQRGDLVYWPGHTGVLLDPDTLLHATAHTMLSLVESLDAVDKRAGEMVGIRRVGATA